MIRKLAQYHPMALDFALLVARVCFSAGMLTHGWPKLVNFSERASRFADPFGLGSTISLGMAVFAEFFCSVLLLVGLYARIALNPLSILTITIVFVIHGADPFGRKESAVLYMVAFITLFFTGPGKYSIDGIRK